MPGARRTRKGQTEIHPSAQIRGDGAGYATSNGPDHYDGRKNTNAGTALNPEEPTRATGVVVNTNEK